MKTVSSFIAQRSIKNVSYSSGVFKSDGNGTSKRPHIMFVRSKAHTVYNLSLFTGTPCKMPSL